MTDQVIIEGLECQAVIGVYEWEKQIRQLLVLDLTMAWDNQPAATADDYHKALCYDSVAKAVTHLVEHTPYQLVETVAEKVAERVQQQFSVSWIQVQVRKPGAVGNARSVGVRIERGSR